MTRKHAAHCPAVNAPYDFYANLGVEATSSTPRQFTDFIQLEAAKFAKVLREAGAKVN